MPLTGNIETFHITNVLQLLHNDQKTGILTVTRGDESIKVYIRNGDIIHATRSHEKNRLGDLLVKHGIIDEKQLQECLNHSRKNNIPLGKVIVEKNFTTANSLGKIIFKQAENAIYDMFLWGKGEFTYTDKEFSTRGMVVRKINIMNIILEAARRVDEMPVLKQMIPNEDLVFEASDTIREGGKIKLNPDEWSILALIDGKLPVKRIISESVFDKFTVYQILNSLISSGHITTKETLSPQQQAVEVFNALKRVDAKTVRKALDDLGLPRSSTLRLIVTRIARDAFSPEELRKLVDLEAKKILNPEDRGRLSELQEKTKLSFLKALFGLLLERVEAV